MDARVTRAGGSTLIYQHRTVERDRMIADALNIVGTRTGRLRISDEPKARWKGL